MALRNLSKTVHHFLNQWVSIPHTPQCGLCKFYSSSIVNFLSLINDHNAKGLDQKTPPAVPSRIILTIVSKSLFGAPKDAPNMGNKKVRNETGINCFRVGSQKPIRCDIFLTTNAEVNIIAIKMAKALEKFGGSSPIITMSTATNVAKVAPVPAPAPNVYFQFTWELEQIRFII